MITTAGRTGQVGTKSEQWSSPETAATVLAYLLDVADQNDIAVVSIRDIRETCGHGAGTTKRAVRRLLDGGHLELLRRGTGGQYRSRYRVHAKAQEHAA